MGLEEASVEASEEEDSVADLVVVLAVISQTKICMLITVGLIHQVVPADLVEADWQWMDTVVVAGMGGKVVILVDTSRNPVSRSWFEMCVVFSLFESSDWSFLMWCGVSCPGPPPTRIWLNCLKRLVKWSWQKFSLMEHVQRDVVLSSLPRLWKLRRPLPSSKATCMVVGL